MKNTRQKAIRFTEIGKIGNDNQKAKKNEQNERAAIARNGRWSAKKAKMDTNQNEMVAANAAGWSLRGKMDQTIQTEDNEKDQKANSSTQTAMARVADKATQTMGDIVAVDQNSDEIDFLRAEIKKLRRENVLLTEKAKRQKSSISLDQVVISTPRGRPRSAMGEISNTTLKRRSDEFIQSGGNLFGDIQTPKARANAKDIFKIAYNKLINPTPSPEKLEKDKKMTAQMDLGVTLLTNISFKARRKLKKLLSPEFDVFASTRKFEEQKKKMIGLLNYEWSEDGALFCTNIKQMLGRRIQTMEKNGLDFIHWPNPWCCLKKIQVALYGDKGGKDQAQCTKFGLQIINIEHPNSPANFTLLSLFFGDDSHRNLEKNLKPVLEQIEEMMKEQNEQNFIKIKEEDEEFNLVIEWFIGGDMKFLSAFMGHMTASARFPCAICLAKKGQLDEEAEMRTSKTIEEDVMNPNHPHSYSCLPLLPIHPSDIIMPSFHILLGIANFALQLLRELANVEEFDKICKRVHAKRDPRKKDFTGEGVKKLLKRNLEEELTDCIQDEDAKSCWNDVWRTVREISKLTKARRIRGTPQELAKIEIEANFLHQQFSAMAQFFPHNPKLAAKLQRMSPKLHWLKYHAPQFLRRHYWWSLVSEQAVENLHSKFNYLLTRFRNQGERQKILKKIADHQSILNCLHDSGINFEKGVGETWVDFVEESNKENE